MSGPYHAKSGSGVTDDQGRLEIQDVFEGDTVKLSADKEGMVGIKDLVTTAGNQSTQKEMLSLSEKLQVSSYATER